MEILDNILIFKTDIKTQFDKHRVKDLLDTINSIEEWSVDMEDIDCVLRVVSTTNNINEIITIIKKAGYECSELE